MKEYIGLISSYREVIVAEVFERDGVDFKRCWMKCKEIKSKFDASTTTRLENLALREYPGVAFIVKDKSWINHEP